MAEDPKLNNLFNKLDNNRRKRVTLQIMVWILVFSRFGFLSALGKLFQAPIYGWFIISTFLVDPAIGGLLVLFLILIVVVTWPRFPNDTVPSFLSGFNDNPPHQSS